MKRFQVTYLGKPFMLYGNSEAEVRSKYSTTMDENSECVLLEYPKELFDKITSCDLTASCQHNENEVREYYLKGNCQFRISKDVRDGCYYDLIQYRKIYPQNGMPKHCLWSVCTAQEFLDRYFKEVPIKETGYVVTPKEIKKIAKLLFKSEGYSIWADKDGYFYFGYNHDWGKRAKDEYDRVHPYADTAVLVWWQDSDCKYKKKWFTSWEEFERLHPRDINKLPPEIKKRGYKALPVMDRKLICRLAYCDIERELAEGTPSYFIAKDWIELNKRCFKNPYSEIGFLENIVKHVDTWGGFEK